MNSCRILRIGLNMLDPELWPFQNPRDFPSTTYDYLPFRMKRNYVSQQRLFLRRMRTERINTMRRRELSMRGSSASPTIIQTDLLAGAAFLKLLRWKHSYS